MQLRRLLFCVYETLRRKARIISFVPVFRHRKNGRVLIEFHHEFAARKVHIRQDICKHVIIPRDERQKIAPVPHAKARPRYFSSIGVVIDDIHGAGDSHRIAVDGYRVDEGIALLVVDDDVFKVDVAFEMAGAGYRVPEGVDS